MDNERDLRAPTDETMAWLASLPTSKLVNVLRDAGRISHRPEDISMLAQLIERIRVRVPEGGDIIFECAKIALTVLRPDSPDWATYRRLVDGTPLGVGDLAYAWATGCNHMSTHIHAAIMELKESSTPQGGRT